MTDKYFVCQDKIEIATINAPEVFLMAVAGFVVLVAVVGVIIFVIRYTSMCLFYLTTIYYLSWLT